jgi:hypothetical protein
MSRDVHSCIHWPRHHNAPLPPHLDSIYEGAIGQQSYCRRHYLVTSWFTSLWVMIDKEGPLSQFCISLIVGVHIGAKGAARHLIDMVCLYRSSIPGWRRWVFYFYLSKLYLPIFAVPRRRRWGGGWGKVSTLCFVYLWSLQWFMFSLVHW